MNEKTRKSNIILAVIQLLLSSGYFINLITSGSFFIGLSYKYLDDFDKFHKQIHFSIIIHLIITAILIGIAIYRTVKSENNNRNNIHKTLLIIRIILLIFILLFYINCYSVYLETTGNKTDFYNALSVSILLMLFLPVVSLGRLFIIVESITYMIKSLSKDNEITADNYYDAVSCMNCRFCHFDQYNNQYACDVFRTKEEMDRNFAENNGMCRNYIRNNIYSNMR